MSTISRIASGALDAFGLRQAVAASNVANSVTPGFAASDTVMTENRGGGVRAEVRQGSDRVEISREAVTMMVTAHGYGASLKALQVSDRMIRDALDLSK